MKEINYKTLTKEEYQSLFEDKDYKSLFEELKKRVKEKGLDNKIPIRGTIEITIVLSIFFLAIYSAFNFHYLVTTGLFILAFWRSMFVAHDVIHYQYYKNRKLNKNLGYIFGNVIMGASRDWWEREHNVQHHTWTNSDKVDRDIRALNGVFIEEKTGPNFIHKYKRPIFWLAIFFMWHSFHQQTWQHILDPKKHHRMLNLITICLHYILVPGVIFTALPLMEAFLSITLIYSIFSVFSALGFITNHIGMEVIKGDRYKQLPWMELQTRTSRNIKGGWLVHWAWGGLNTQIEHHLFPKAPRLNLLEIAKITEDFCKENGLFYYATKPLQGFKEVDLELQEKGRFNY